MRRITALALTIAAFAALAAPATAGTKTVNWGYFPANLTIAKNDTVKWSWANAVPGHNVYIKTSSGKAVKNSGSAKKTASYSYKFTSKGTFTVYCKPHQSIMSATVTVG